MTTELRKAMKRIKKEKKRKSSDDGATIGKSKKRKSSSSTPKENKSQNRDDCERIESKRRKDTLTTSAAARAAAVTFPHRYIVAPMVGASELPFRLLTRKYGAQLVYTPMMVASEFVKSEEYRAKEFQTTPFDRPLVCHFAAVS